MRGAIDRPNAVQILQAASIWVAVAGSAFLLWRVRNALLIALGAVLAAILLRGIASRISRWTKLSEGYALAVSTLLVLAACGFAVWLFGSHLIQELGEVFARIQAAEVEIKGNSGTSGVEEMLQKIEQGGSAMVSGSVGTLLSAGMGLVEGGIVILISGIYLAAQPRLYRGGAVQLFPPALRLHAGDALDTIGDALRLWLLGQLSLMLIVGVLSLVAVWVIGLPDPLALGWIAGVTEIVPYLGPFLGGAPAVLVAFTQGPVLALWTVGAYVLIHFVEGYLVGPLLQRYFVTIPPVLMLLGIVGVDLIFGPVGLLFAAPIAVVGFVAVKMLYVRDTLKQPTDLPGH